MGTILGRVPGLTRRVMEGVIEGRKASGPKTRVNCCAARCALRGPGPGLKLARYASSSLVAFGSLAGEAEGCGDGEEGRLEIVDADREEGEEGGVD